LRGLARIGILALVDEATGYQDVRDPRLRLQVILNRYLKDEWSKWTKRFPNDFSTVNCSASKTLHSPLRATRSPHTLATGRMTLFIRASLRDWLNG